MHRNRRLTPAAAHPDVRPLCRISWHPSS
jgi:hypothetical protein